MVKTSTYQTLCQSQTRGSICSEIRGSICSNFRGSVSSETRGSISAFFPQDLLNKKLEQQKVAFLASQQTLLDSIRNSITDTMQAEVNDRKDSVSSWGMSKRKKIVQDSLAIKRLEQDTHRLAERHRVINAKRQEIMNKKTFIDSTIAADSAKYEYYKTLIDNPEKNATAWLKENGFPSQLLLLSKIKNLETGVVTPYLHNYSLSGIGLKGSNVTLGSTKVEFTLSGGKSIISDIGNYNRLNAKYERAIVGSAVNFSINKKTNITLFGHFIQDPTKKFSEQGRNAKQNAIVGTNIKYVPSGKLPNVEFALAKSHFRSTNTAPSNVQFSGVPAYSFRTLTQSTLAYKVIVEKDLIKGLNMSGSAQFVGPQFKNLGNPFMRTNFIEKQLKTKMQLLNAQLQMAAFYKTLKDNPLKITEITNTTSGYGLSMNTRFKNKKLPNFNASVSPYEQGNNHPDSLFKVNSQFSIITAGMTYRTGRKTKYFLMVYGSQSQMQFNDSFSAKVQTLSISQDLSLGKKLTLGLSSTFMRTHPSVDSSQANINQARIAYRLGKSTSINATGTYTQFLNGAYRKGFGITISGQINKKIRLSIKSGYDHYYKLWGIGNQKAVWGLCRLDWTL